MVPLLVVGAMWFAGSQLRPAPDVVTSPVRGAPPSPISAGAARARATGWRQLDYCAIEQRVAGTLGEVERGLHAQVLARLDIERMDYAGARRQGLPIGSGNVEATCKSLSDRWAPAVQRATRPLAKAVQIAAGVYAAKSTKTTPYPRGVDPIL